MTIKKADSEDKVETKTKKEVIQVVDKLPVQEVRRIEKEDVIINLITIEEYLTAQANARTE